jgi:hypothetical protein
VLQILLEQPQPVERLKLQVQRLQLALQILLGQLQVQR